MRAYVLGEDGPGFAEIERPRPGPNEVLVRVAAGALNRADLGMARGRPHGRAGGPGTTLGVEWSGEVVDLGDQVTGFSRGDRVMGSGGGAFAEYVAADVGRVQPIPDANLSFEVAATLPVSLQTMHDAVVTNGALQPGQSVMISGASSGVGLMAMQIAKAMGAAFVVGSSSDPDRRARLTQFGADLAVDTRDVGWVDAVLEATSGQGVDLIVDQVSGPDFNALMRATRIGGRIVNVGRLGGERAEFDFDLHALRRLTYVGVTFRTRSKAEVAEIVRRMRQDLWGALSKGEIALPIDKVFDFDALPDAYAHMTANRHFGKIVVRVAAL